MVLVGLVALVLVLVRFSDLPYAATTGGAHQPSSISSCLVGFPTICLLAIFVGEHAL